MKNKQIKFNSLKPDKLKKRFNDKQQQYLFEVITNKIKYHNSSFTNDDLDPDLILKIKIPEKQYMPKNQYLPLESFVKVPPAKLEKVYKLAQNQIMQEMQKSKQNNDPNCIKIRFQKSLKVCRMQTKTQFLINENDEKQVIELQCINEYNGILDAFIIQYNSIIYLLQNNCGFKIKSFLLYSKNMKQRSIFIFLKLSLENLMKIALKYRIKKQIDYSFIEFYFNQPTAYDRPIQSTTYFKEQGVFKQILKKMNRYFRIKQNSQYEELIEQKQLKNKHIQQFQAYEAQTFYLYLYLKYVLKDEDNISQNQKEYLHYLTFNCISNGGFKYYSIIKKRRIFMEGIRQSLEKYKYQVYGQYRAYQQFMMDKDHMKSHYSKLQNLFLYKPNKYTADGKLELFTKMQRIKLNYLAIKDVLKINYLEKIGYQVFSLDNDLQKFGVGGNKQYKGGLNGKNLVDNWPSYGLFSDIEVIRDYIGDYVSFNIHFINTFILYFSIVSIEFTIIFIIQKFLKQDTFIYSTPAAIILYAISFKICINYWQKQQLAFCENYYDGKSSKTFLSKFRGCYKRNPLTDQANQFDREKGLMSLISNLACITIIIASIVIFGAIFHGCRMFLLAIYNDLSQYRVPVESLSISLPHFLAYSLFFLSSSVFNYIGIKYAINLLIYLMNPPTDEDEQYLRNTFELCYFIGIEIIPLVFFLFIQYFPGNSCYSINCQTQIVFYLYSKVIFTLIQQIYSFILLMIANTAKLKNLFHQKEEDYLYHDKLSTLLIQADKVSKQKDYKCNIVKDSASIITYALYCTLLPVLTIICFFTLFIRYTNTRIGLIYQNRRPINKSEGIFLVFNMYQVIYYFGMVTNIWFYCFLYDVPQKYLQNLIDSVSENKANASSIYLFKMAIVLVSVLLLDSIASTSYMIFEIFFPFREVRNHKKIKYKQYIYQKRKSNIKNLQKMIQINPIGSIFRTFNQVQILQQQQQNPVNQKNNNSQNSFNRLTKKSIN